MVEDNNTKFGVYVNQQRIEDKQSLKPMDVIRIGDTLFLFQDGKLYYNHRDVAKNLLQINIEERSVWNLFKKKVLLSDIKLSIQPGEMVLILGGSGAGKTTFVNAVMGYEKAKGQILEGDIDIYKNYNQMKYNIAFVPQQDLLRMEDTVIGTMENAAEMKLPRSVKSAERKARVDAVLETLGLEREKNTKVSKLSGGQRKRLSIAVEFISDPTLFFLDEPDSGLDGVMARSLMEKLRDISDQNTIVMVITHQPDRVEDLFDKIIVLAKSPKDNVGHMAFFGTIEESMEFFDTDTIEGIVKRINRPDEGGEGRADEFIEKYRKIEEKGNE
ncbi:MAG: ABC transporter ATP-binding protein [Lachnospiraceae bacterium]|nr:ABC transporter ATP-binding protein [Candidatus Equihabitans merdae]